MMMQKSTVDLSKALAEPMLFYFLAVKVLLPSATPSSTAQPR